MLDCLGGQPCHETVLNNTSSCGSDFAYVFFPSFYFVSSILVNLIYAIFGRGGGEVLTGYWLGLAECEHEN